MTTQPASATERSVARVLRSWQRFKRSHPEFAQLVAPLLLRTWQVALRRRASWAPLARPGGASSAGATARAARSAVTPVRPDLVIEDPGQLVAARVEHVIAVPGEGMFVAGWLVDPNERVTRVIGRCGEHSSGDLLWDLVRMPRPDVDDSYRTWTTSARRKRYGFATLVRLEGVSEADLLEDFAIELSDDSGHAWTLVPRPIVHDAADSLAIIQAILLMVRPRTADVLDRHVGPTIAALWSPAKPADPTIRLVGSLPVEPRASVVVPIYRRYDFIEYQLACFAGDPDFRDTELIYVIDDPDIRDDVVQLCASVHPIFQVPMRLVLCQENNGFAGATNLGAKTARGSLLVLLNSDVIPASHGWLSALEQAYEKLPDEGALGARLLFPDGSVQHDGMRFEQAPWFPGIWLNEHPGKGLPPKRTASREPVAVDAVTAACLMLARERFEEVGGLDEGYVIGDFEDSDLCLKLRERGLGSYVAPWIELYHLERQSLSLSGDADWRQSLTLYNAWRHTQRWASMLGTFGQDAAHG